MVITPAFILCNPPDGLADFRDGIETQINRHSRQTPRDLFGTALLISLRDGVNLAIDRQGVDVPKLQRIVSGEALE